MNSNQKAMQSAIKQYRKELEAMLGEVSQVDVRALNKALDLGVREVKDMTPVGIYKNRTGGTLRKGWYVKPARKLGKVVQGSLYNNVEYASFVNYGHRMVNKNGETIGWVKGKFMLEKAISRSENVMIKEFKKEIERINQKYGK